MRCTNVSQYHQQLLNKEVFVQLKEQIVKMLHKLK